MACSIERAQDGRINKVLDESGKPSKLFQNIFNVPILSLEESIEIYKNTYSEKVRQKKDSNKNVDFIYNQSEELKSIGTKQDYKNYLETVFPDSKVSEVVYHGTKRDFDVFDERQIGTESDKNKVIGDFGEGFYFTEVLTRAQGYATDMQTGKQVGRVISALVNIQNPESSTQKTKEQLSAEGIDGVIVSYGNRKYDEIVVPNANQIYILGSQTDLENFRNWRQSSSEPTLLFKTPSGEKFVSYQEALQNTPEGDIELMINNVAIAKVNSDTSIDNYNGLLNHFVKQGLLKSERILDVNGDQLFIPSGETDSAIQLSANILEDLATKQLGASSVIRLDDGSFLFEDNLNTRIINGEKIKESELDNLNFEQLKNKFGEDVAISLEVEKQFEKDMLPSKLKRRLDEDTEVKTEDELVRSAKSLLNKLGIAITSIEEYVNNDTIKNGGVPTSASALVDMVNKVVAFRDGTISREDLIEETSHLIEASLPLDRTIGLRNNIHTTPEWKEHSAKYYDIYSKEYSGEKLDDMVRREILGKVIANGISTNFELSQDSTQTQQSIFQQIRQLLDEFFAKVNAYFTDNLRTQIDQLNKDIYVKLLSGELANELNVNQNFGDKFRLYSASTNLNNDLVQIQMQAEKSISILESQHYELSKNDASQRQELRSAKESLGRAQEKIKEVENQTDVLSKAQQERLASDELAASFSHITNVAQKQLTYLERAVKRNEENNFHFTAEEEAVYQNMISEFDNNILPYITSVLEKKSRRTGAEERILQEVKKVSDSIEKVKQAVGKNNDNYKQVLVDLLVKRLNLSADKREFIEKQIDSTQQEVSWFFLNFGALMHSSSIYLNAAAHVATKMDYETRQGSLLEVLPFIKRLKDAGYLNAKVRDFARDGFIENRFDDKARENAIAEARYSIYKEVSGDNLSKEDFEKKDDFSNLTAEQRQVMDQKFSDWKLENYMLTALKPEEIQERNKRLENYSDITKNYERVSSNFYANLMQNAEIVDGIPRFTKEMRYDFEQQKKQRRYDKSVFDVYGNLRAGIETRTEEEYNKDKNGNEEVNIVKAGNGLYVSLIPNNSDNASTLAFELNKLDNNRLNSIKENKEEKEFSPEFIKTLQSFNDSEEAYDFLMLNSYVGYTNEYYDRFTRPSVIEKLTNELGKENDWRIQDLIDKISQTSAKMNVILQANRVMNTPSEIDFSRMELSTEVPQVKQYAQELERYYSEASKLLPGNEEIEEDNLSETIPNQAFQAYMSDKHIVDRLVYEKDILEEDDIDNINKIFSEIISHSTENNQTKILSLRKFVKDFSNGKESRIPKAYKSVFKLTEQEYQDMSAEQTFASMTNDLLQYSYTRLLPYFRKSQPIGADTALNELRTGIVSPAAFIENYQNGQYEFLNITPNYNFQNANAESNKNPHFQQAKVQGIPMFRTFETSTTLEDVKNKSVDQLYKEGKLNKFVSLDFLKEYDIDLVKLFETGEETARKNEKKFEARQAFLDLQKQSLANYGVTGSHNLYQLPQKEKSKTRKLEDILNNGAGIKAIADEYLNYREDEESTGQDKEGRPARNMISATIPKHGLRKLREGEPTDSLIESYTWLNKESNRYKARKANIGDMLVIKQSLLSSKFENNLKVESSNAYKMFEDAMAHNFYGYKETFSKEFQYFGKTGNWGQVLKTFGGLIRFRNLAYNLTIPITSALSGSVQTRIERIVGQRIDVDGLSRANNRFKDTAGDAMRDVMDIGSTSWLNSMGAKWGWFETEERYHNSTYGKFVRGLGRSAYVAHTMFNFPINPRVGLAVLSDHRFVQGKILQYQDFKADNKGKSDKEIREIWKNYKDITDVSIVDEQTGVVTYDYQKISDALNTNMTIEETKQFMSNAEILIAGRVKEAIQAVDQQISEVDRSIAARNSIFSFILTHRSWLTLAAQNKFKRRQFSTITSRIEEGSWNSVFRVVNELYRDIRSGKARDFIPYIKNRWVNGDSVTRRNIVRTVAEMSILNLIVALVALGLKELDDNDKDSYAFKLGTLFTTRVGVEVASSSFGLPRNLYDTLNGLVVGLNTLDILFDAPDLLSGDNITKGRYAGLSERQRYLIKNVPIPMLKEYNSLVRDIDGTIDAYKYFNITQGKSFDYFTLYSYLNPKEEK